MKTFKYILLCGATVMVTFVYGQSPCSLPIIVTDPDNPVNTERSDQLNAGVNAFDWRSTAHLPDDFSGTYPIPYYDQDDEMIESIPNPFYDNEAGTANLNNATPKDFQPQDGWELVKKDFGYLEDGVTPNLLSAPAPYFILYNRYSGTLRVIASSLDLGALGVQNINVTLKFIAPDPTLVNYANLQATGLFNNAASPASANETISGVVFIKILNSMGVEVSVMNVTNLNNITVDLSKEPSGIYYVQLISDQQVISRKLILEV